MSDRKDETEHSFDSDVAPPPRERSEPGWPQRPSTSLVRQASDSYLPHPFGSWLSRLWRTLAFRPGVYIEMMGDRHATWQASTAWLGASLGSAFSVFTYSGPVLTGILQMLAGSVIALVLWTGVVYVASRMLSKSDPHSYRQTIRLVGFSMVPGLGLLVAPYAIFSFWGLAMQIHGLREGIGLTWPRAVVVAVIPWLMLGVSFFLLLLAACGMGAC